MKIKLKPQSNKKLDLPVGVSATWRTRPNKRPYFEYQVFYKDEMGKHKTKHFYVGVNIYPDTCQLIKERAIKFRKDYELSAIKATIG